MEGVYLLHLMPPYRHARHYAGYSSDIGRRLQRHAHGHGGRLVQVALAAGCSFALTRVWPGHGRVWERHIKRGGMARYCPLCCGRVAAADYLWIARKGNTHAVR